MRPLFIHWKVPPDDLTAARACQAGLSQRHPSLAAWCASGLHVEQFDLLDA